VELIFKTRTYKTRISKYATIYSNDPDQPTTKIHMAAHVYPSPDTSLPFMLSLEKVNLSKDSKKSKIVLENKSDSRLYIESAGEVIDGLSVKVKNDDPKPGQKSELRFEWKNEFEKENAEKSITFLVYGSGKDTTRFSVPILLQGTDPAPIKVRKPPKRRSVKSTKTKSKIIRKPARHTATAAEDPRVVKPAEAKKADTSQPVATEKLVPSPTAKEKLSLEKKTKEIKPDDSSNKSDIESGQNE